MDLWIGPKPWVLRQKKSLFKPIIKIKLSGPHRAVW